MKFLEKKSKKNLRALISDFLEHVPTDFFGGCSLSKAYVLAWIISKYQLTKTIDIGVYRGRSLFPQALAHSLYTGGCVYGIDPYTKKDAMQHDDHEIANTSLNDFVKKTDFEKIYEEILDFIDKFGLMDHCMVMRRRSDDAVHFF